VNAALFWIFILSLLASQVVSTLSYTFRMMSRVALEEALAHFRRASALDFILESRHNLALTISTLRLIVNAGVVLSAAAYFMIYFAPFYDKTGNVFPFVLQTLGGTLLVSAPALLIFSVAIPHAWAKYAGESLIAAAWPFIRAAYWFFFPVVKVMTLFDELIRRLAGVSHDGNPGTEAEQVEQEIMAVISEGTAEGAVDEEQKKMIEGVISFRDLQVGQIMTPRTDITALEVNAGLNEIREKILKDGLSRVPVFENTLDNIVGILHAKDLLANLGTPETPVQLRQVMRPAYFVPRTKPLRDLLREFRLQQVHMAVVLDEYGGTSGLVTTEDILEEIVGDIADEYEHPQAQEIKRLDDHTVEIDARMNITDLNRLLDLHLPEDQNYQTVGGFMIYTLGTIPAKGETLAHETLTFTVLDAEPRRIKRLKLQLPLPDPDDQTPVRPDGQES